MVTSLPKEFVIPDVTRKVGLEEHCYTVDTILRSVDVVIEVLLDGNQLVQFAIPTNDQRVIVTRSIDALRELYRRGFGYKKAGVIATHIMPVENIMRSLFEDTISVERERKLTSVVDAVNKTFGRGTVKLAVQGSGRIKTSSEKQSPHYTTKWSDIPEVTVK